MFTDQDCGSPSHSGLDPHQELLAFHDLDRQLEIDQPRPQEGQRKLVLRVDIIGAVGGVGLTLKFEEQSAPESALRAKFLLFGSAGGFCGLGMVIGPLLSAILENAISSSSVYGGS